MIEYTNNYEALDATDGLCGLVHVTLGRCARQASVEVHHIKLRSHGGSDEPENLVPLCPHHHRQIHPEPFDVARLALVLVDRHGQILPEGGGLVPEAFNAYRQHGGKYDGATWELWTYPHVRARWEEVAVRAVTGLRSALLAVDTSAWTAAYWLHELTHRHLWPLLGIGIDPDPDDIYRPLIAFAKLQGRRPDQFRAWVRAEERRRSLPMDEQELVRQTPIRLMRDAGSVVLNMDRDERLGIWRMVAEDGENTEPIIESLREKAAVNEAERVNLKRWEVSGRLIAEWEIRVSAPSAVEALKMAKRRVGGYKPISGGNAEFSRERVREVTE